MKNNTTLVTAFTIATGLVSTAAAAGVDASAGTTAYYQEVQDVKMVHEAGDVPDKIVWGGLLGPHSEVSDNSTLVPADLIPSFFPPPSSSDVTPRDISLLDFLRDREEIRKDVDYRPFEIVAAFAPADFRDRRDIMLDDLYFDDRTKLLESRERPAFVIVPPAAVDRIAEYRAPGGGYVDNGGRVEDPTPRLQLAALEDKAVTVPESTTLTAAEILALLKGGDVKLSEEQYIFLKGLYSKLLFTSRDSEAKYDDVAAGMHGDGTGLHGDPVTFTPDLKTLELIKGIKDAAASAEQVSAHVTFHVGDKLDVLTPHDVWTGGDVFPDKEFHDIVTIPLTVTDLAPAKFSSCGGFAC